MKNSKILALVLLASISFWGLLRVPNAQAGGFSGGYWWANCPATATFPVVAGNTNGSGYQTGLGPVFDTGTLSLQRVSVGGTYPQQGTLLECYYSDNVSNSLITLSPPDYPSCRATGSFGWFQCHQ
jgi:hypothetical protein